MMLVRRIVAAAVLATVLAGNAVPRSMGGPVSPDAVSRLERYLTGLEARGFSGSVLVESGGTIALSHGYGLADRERGLKNTPSTVFDIGSITKQFTAAAILTLEMDGRLSVRDSIGRYFPGVPADKAGITLHQLLRHASGLRSNIGRDYDPITAAAFVDSVLRSPLRFPPGTRFSYSNIGYSLLGMVIEKAAGMPYEDYLATRLWEPAGMTSTGYRRAVRPAAVVAIGYDRDEKLWGRPTEKAWDSDGPFWHLKGNGGILSTTGDLLRWHRALLGNKVLSDAAKAQYFHPELRSDETPDSYYAYGWDVHRTPRNTLVIQHNGANGFFYADFSRYPVERVAIITLSNRMHPHFRELNLHLARIVFDSAYVPSLPVADNEANRSFTASTVDLAVREGAQRAIDAYGKRGPGLDLIEFRVNDRGYELLGAKQVREAIEVFRVNVHAFPSSANAFDSLGEAYMTAGLNVQAIENYRKSLALDPGNENAAEMLKELTGQ